jgi:hypothetical protein
MEDDGEKRLVAYYTVKNEGEEEGSNGIGAEELREYLGQILPEYMVPGMYFRLENMPRMANGNVDRKALRLLEGSAHGSREYEAPQGETETVLAAIWAEVLRLERVGRHDNFFELGGNSLLAVQLASRIRIQLHLELEVKDIFLANTIKEMAVLITSLTCAKELLLTGPQNSAGERYL